MENTDANSISYENNGTKLLGAACSKCITYNDMEQIYGPCTLCKKYNEIASEEWSLDKTEHFGTLDIDNSMKCLTESDLSVFNYNKRKVVKEFALANTAVNTKNVPDRIGMFVNNYSTRSDTKFLIEECKSKSQSSANEYIMKDIVAESLIKQSEGKCFFAQSNECKVSLLKCLTKSGAANLRKSFKMDFESESCLENFAGDCLDSTSKAKEISSQENSVYKKYKEVLGIKTDVVNNNDIFTDDFISIRKVSCKRKGKMPVKERLSTTVKKDNCNCCNIQKNLKHVCSYCQKIFKSNGKLNSHVYSHTGERPFNCSHCDKAFSSKFKLVRHLLIHSEVRKFVCQICDRTFLRNDHLKNHYKVHDPQKKTYKCSRHDCNKEYSSLTSHKKHLAYHNVEDGDLKCLICNIKFEAKEEILFHLKSHSSSRPFKTQTDKKFKCELCDRLFLTRKDVNRHLVVHTGLRDFLCQFCPQRFGRKDHLLRHIKKSHQTEEMSIKKEICTKETKGTYRTLETERKVMKTSKKVSETTIVLSDTHLNSIISNNYCKKSILNNAKNREKKELVSKTHILITVQDEFDELEMANFKKNSFQNLKNNNSFQKEGTSTSLKKQTSSLNSKHSTEIFLQNIPTIFLLPSNSIILLRNQPCPVKSLKIKQGQKILPEDTLESSLTSPEAVNWTWRDLRQSFPEELPFYQTQHVAEDSSLNLNLSRETNPLQPYSHISSIFSDSDIFTGVHSDFPFLGSQCGDRDQLNFEMITPNELLFRTEIPSNPKSEHNNAINGVHSRSEVITYANLLTEASRHSNSLQIGNNIEEKSENLENLEKITFEENTGALMLGSSILNTFNDSVLSPSEHNIDEFYKTNNVSNERCSFKLLRNLLTNEKPRLSPLPGFNQIFQNSNPNLKKK